MRICDIIPLDFKTNIWSNNQMITEFGKILRVIRVNRGINAREMSAVLNISPSYLSSIENGKRSIPDSLLVTLLSKYNLTELEIDQLNNAVKDTREVKLDITELPDNKRRLVLALAQDDLDDEKIDYIIKITKGSK